MKYNCPNCEEYWKDILKHIWGKEHKKEFKECTVFCPVCQKHILERSTDEIVKRDA